MPIEESYCIAADVRGISGRRDVSDFPGCEDGVDLPKITCASCRHAWPILHVVSVYEQQAVEACPCPACGAYTLRFPTPRNRQRTPPDDLVA